MRGAVGRRAWTVGSVAVWVTALAGFAAWEYVDRQRKEDAKRSVMSSREVRRG